MVRIDQQFVFLLSDATYFFFCFHLYTGYFLTQNTLENSSFSGSPESPAGAYEELLHSYVIIWQLTEENTVLSCSAFA